MELKIIEVINKPKGLSTKDGMVLYEKIKPLYYSLGDGDCLVLDFEGIKDIITAFLNASIGQVYCLEEPKVVDKKIVIKNFPEERLYRLEDVKEFAESWYEKNIRNKKKD